MKMLTKKQQEVLSKIKKEGYKDLSRVEYKHIKTIKERCMYIIENYKQAVKILIKLVRKKWNSRILWKKN